MISPEVVRRHRPWRRQVRSFCIAIQVDSSFAIMARVISFMYVFLILWPVLAFPSIQSHRINQGAHWSDGSDHTANRRQSLGLSMSMRRDSKHRRVNALNSINSKKFTTNSADHSNIFRFRGGFTGNYNSDSFSSGGGFGIDGGRGDGGGNDGSNLAMIGSSDGEGDNNKPVSSTPLESLLSLLKEMLNAYSRALKANPYLVKMVSSGVIGGTGDFLIQKLQNKDTGKPFDLRRFAIFTSVATFYIAPVINIWFNYLSTLSAFTPGFSALGNALVMTAVDQTVGALVINAGFFFAFELVR